MGIPRDPFWAFLVSGLYSNDFFYFHYLYLKMISRSNYLLEIFAKIQAFGDLGNLIYLLNDLPA